MSFTIPTDYECIESPSSNPRQKERRVNFKSRSFGRLNVQVGREVEVGKPTALEEQLKGSSFLVNKPKIDTWTEAKLGNGTEAIRVRHKGYDHDKEYLFFLHEERLISFESDFPNKYEKGQKEVIDQIAATVTITDQLQGPAVVAKGSPSSSSQTESWSVPSWLRPYVEIIPILLVGLLLVTPVYLGAGRGFEFDGRPKAGSALASASGAFSGVFFSVCLGGVIAFVMAFVSFSGNEVHGIASSSGAIFMSGVVILMAGTAVLTSSGLMAAAGASLGAQRSRPAAQRLAALFALLGLALPALLKGWL